jgi:LysR family hydrogen peroxide-inducible transcriptional activator
MTITQLEYIVALADLKSFSKAADFCCVTQPSLSMQVQKLEDELNVSLFNRKSKPLAPTLYGEDIIRQARVILKETQTLMALSKGWGNQVSGSLSIGIIPTIAPYLVPKFLAKFQRKYPELSISIAETTTENIKKELKEGKIHIGILVTPMNDQLIEKPLFYEELYLYSNYKNEKNQIVEEILTDQLWLLEEGHCLSNQVASICNLKSNLSHLSKISYQTGSLETIVRLVEDSEGQTIIPQMLVDYLEPSYKSKVFSFKEPVPVREVSLVYSPSYARKAIIKALEEEILNVIPAEWQVATNRNVIPI